MARNQYIILFYLFIYCHLYSTFSIVQYSNALYRLWDGEIQGHTGQPSVREINAHTMCNEQRNKCMEVDIFIHLDICNKGCDWLEPNMMCVSPEGGSTGESYYHDMGLICSNVTLCTISEQPLLAEASTILDRSLTHLCTFSNNNI